MSKEYNICLQNIVEWKYKVAENGNTLYYIPSVVALLVIKIDVFEQLVSHINRSIRLGVFLSVSFE